MFVTAEIALAVSGRGRNGSQRALQNS